MSQVRQETNKGPSYTLIITAAIIFALVVAFFAFSGVYADILWYDQIGFLSILTTQWFTVGVLFAIGFLIMSITLWITVRVAYNTRPVYASLGSQLDRYQEVFEPLRKLAFWVVPIVFGIFFGLSFGGLWQQAQIWLNATAFGQVDPQFGLDYSFYVFQLPFYQAVLPLVQGMVFICGLAVLAIAYLYGSIRISERQLRVAKSTRIQVAIIAAVLAIIQGASLWLEQYKSLTSGSSDRLIGASYTDVNATIPALQIVAIIAAIVALLFIVTAVIGKWRYAIVGTGLMIVSSILVTGVYPQVIQRLQVVPSEGTLERPYLQRNIEATRAAFGVANVNVQNYSAKTDVESGALRDDAETTTNIRIVDPGIVQPSFAQLEQFKQYYQFASQLDVDRYVINGKVQDTVIGLREINLVGTNASSSWYNETLVYTHGFGVAAAYGNQISSDGQPKFYEGGVPSSGDLTDLGEYEQRIYFGEFSPEYSIVGGAAGATPVEVDYPLSASSSDENTAKTTFQGDGGPKLDSIINRLVYAIKFGSEQIIFSDQVSDNSQILYDRDPRTRVQKAAPYLTIDSDPYPAIVDGKILWIVDAYTTSANYPYSNLVSWGQSITDSNTDTTRIRTDRVNYVRNSVKATVDAYDGSVTLYAWDENDPVLQTWQKIFPGTIKSISDMSGDLMAHVRYPSDLFKVQRSILATYHVTNADSFYSGDNAWVAPANPTSTGDNPPSQPPYYLTMKLPLEESPSFKIYSTFIPRQSGDTPRNVLAGYLAANADAGSVDGVKGANYGELTLLTIPNDAIPGPGQVQNKFNTDPTVAGELNVLELGGSKVLKGNLLTLPVGGGLLYVQPVYLMSTGETSFPLLRKVLVAFGDSIAFEDSLEKALDALFKGDSGAGGEEPSEPGEPGEPTEPGEVSPALKQALEEAATALKEREAALAKGDWAAYGVADAKLQRALERAISLSK